jgi:ferric-chelate reductase
MAGLNYHSQDVVPYLLAIWALLVINTIVRSVTTRITTATIVPLPGANSTLVTFPALNKGFTPGQHVRVRLFVPSLWTSVFESHPFTIASADGEHVSLVVKAAGDWTSSLYDLALENKTMRCSIEGPYGGPLNFLFPAFKSVMIVVGGSGSEYFPPFSSRSKLMSSLFRVRSHTRHPVRCDCITIKL